MGLGSGGTPKWFILICLAFGICVGYVTAAIALSFWGVFAGEEANRGLFVLIWMFAAVVFFAWPMHIVERARAVRRQRQVMRERIGDLDYEPSSFPMLGTRAPGPKDEIEVKAPDIDDRLSRFLARGRTAEQRMADHLESLRLQDEIKKSRDADASALKDPDPPA